MKPRKRVLKNSHPEGMAPGLRQRKLKTLPKAWHPVRIRFWYLGAPRNSEVVHVQDAERLYKAVLKRMPDDDGYGMTLEATTEVLKAIGAKRLKSGMGWTALRTQIWKHKDLALIAEEI